MHLSGVPKVLYSTVLWLCECSGLASALSLECLASRYLYHILKPKGLKIHRSSKHKKQSNKPTTPGFWPCKSDPRCAICKEGHFSTSITSHHNSKTHNIKQSVTCKSDNVCYLIDCSKCKQQYIGETELEFHCRMNNHKSDIRLENKSNGMVRHFSKCGIDNMTPNILEKVRSRDHYIRKAREQYYIELLEPQINAQ